MSISYIVGIDEVGRGPLAGPVTVCACAISCAAIQRFFARDFKGIRDSKKLSSRRREIFFNIAKRARREGKIKYAVSHVGAGTIDHIGISQAVARALMRSLVKLKLDPKMCRVFLDGSLRAPRQFAKQKTIIGGDQSVPIISLASVIAKVTRDRKMTRLARRFPNYGFEIHKGYGTLAHRRAIRRCNLSPLHRRTFCHK